jgi:hypothetical protein
MSFPYMNPIQASNSVELVASGLNSVEVVVFKTNATCTLQSAWAMVNATAAATSNLTCVFYDRGTAGAGTTILGTAGGSGSTWGATTPKSVTLSNNTGKVADSYITALVTRIAASTASAWKMQFGFEYVNGSPATAN